MIGHQVLLAAEESSHNPLIPEPYDIIWSAVVLLIIAAAVLRLLPRFNRILDERAELIQGGIERAERAQAEAKAALAENQQVLAEARAEAGRIREEARAEGVQILAELRERANVESERLRESARVQIESERDTAARQLRSEVGTLAGELASRIVGESLTDEARQSRVIDRFLDELESSDAPAGVSVTKDR